MPSIGRIDTSSPSVNPSFPDSVLGPNQQQSKDPFIHDTIGPHPQKEKDTEEKMRASSSISNFVGWLWGLIFPNAANGNQSLDQINEPSGIKSEAIGHRPKLETPDQIDARSLQQSITEMNHLIQRIKDLSEDTEAMINFENLLMQIFKRQVQDKEETLDIIKEMVNVAHGEKKELSKERAQMIEEVFARMRKSNILDIVDKAATAVLIGMSVVLFVSAVSATGGGIVAAFGGAGTMLQAGSSITKGIAVGAKGVLDHQTDQDNAKIIQTSDRIETNDLKIKENMNELESALRFIFKFYSNLRQSADAQHEAILAMIKK
jgi:hypothetical protein